MTSAADPQVLREFKSKLFGEAAAGERMPAAYLAELQKLISAATARVGYRVSTDERHAHAYWLHGQSVGTLSSTGETDADARITGRVLQFDAVTSVDINVDVVVDSGSGDLNDQNARWGRTVTLRSQSGEIVLDASLANTDQRERVDRFIDEVLTALATR